MMKFNVKASEPTALAKSSTAEFLKWRMAEDERMLAEVREKLRAEFERYAIETGEPFPTEAYEVALEGLEQAFESARLKSSAVH